MSPQPQNSTMDTAEN